MSAQPALANLHTEPGEHASDAQYYRQALHELIDMGTGLARLLHQQATIQAHAAPQDPGPQPAPVSAPDALTSIAVAFDRIARAVRRSIALARSLANPVPPTRDPAQHRAAARKRILREVEDTIQRTAPDGSGTDDADADETSGEALLAELHDRLDAPDLDDDISSRPVGDIITEICRDLGLATLPGTHSWKRRTPADLKQLCAHAAAPSSIRLSGAGPPVPATPQRALTNSVPPGPPALPDATGPTHASSGPPDDPAGTPARIATIPRHPTHLRNQWRPPPEPKQTPEGPHR